MRERTIWLAAGLAGALTACEADQSLQPEMAPEETPAAPAPEPGIGQAEQPERAEEAAEARQLVNDAAKTLQQMKQDAELTQLLNKAQGVFIVPTYGRAAVGIGGQGGEGVLLARQDDGWSDPAFYDVGGISLGAQLGAEGGSVAMLLMSKEALDAFKSDNEFSLDAEAKLTLADYSKLARTQLSDLEEDVVFWSNAEGAFAGATLSASGISWDDEENPAYYGKVTTPEEILSGRLKGPQSELRKELTNL